MSEVVVPLLDLPLGKTPPGKLPSKADFLCLLWGSVGGNFVGFQGIASLCCRVGSCGKEGGCVEQQHPCLLQLLKENWMELGIALQSDKNILQLMKKTKQKFDKMKMSGNLIEASSLSRTTFNLAAADWRDKVNQDRRLRADWRKEKLAFSSFQFAGVNLANVNLEALAKVARRAVKIDLGNAALTADQANAVVIALAENEQIQEVDLSDNSLTDVEPGLLVRALAKTRKLNLANTSLTTEQVKQLLESLLSDNCAMENLDFSANILSMIEPDLMAKSLNKLKVVTLFDSNISVNQVGQKAMSACLELKLRASGALGPDVWTQWSGNCERWCRWWILRANIESHEYIKEKLDTACSA